MCLCVGEPAPKAGPTCGSVWWRDADVSLLHGDPARVPFRQGTITVLKGMGLWDDMTRIDHLTVDDVAGLGHEPGDSVDIGETHMLYQIRGSHMPGIVWHLALPRPDTRLNRLRYRARGWGPWILC